jgi:hypothetical protein
MADASTGWHLAQINVGRLIALPGDPAVAEFVDALDAINAVADATPGFVWRLQSDSGNALDIVVTDDPQMAVNMSVWTDADALFAYVYRSAHTPFMAKRKAWFERFPGAYQALWWVPAGTIPSVDEGLSRLWRLDKFGPTPHAFTFKARFPAPGLDGPPVDMNPDPWCMGTA